MCFWGFKGCSGCRIEGLDLLGLALVLNPPASVLVPETGLRLRGFGEGRAGVARAGFRVQGA